MVVFTGDKCLEGGYFASWSVHRESFHVMTVFPSIYDLNGGNVKTENSCKTQLQLGPQILDWIPGFQVSSILQQIMEILSTLFLYL